MDRPVSRRSIERARVDHWSRRALLWTLLAAGPIASLQCGRDQQTNILMVVIDTLRADHCSTYGYPRPTTPNLTELAADGVLYEQAWSQASWTLPSMVSLMTGRYVLANFNTIPESAVTLAERLRGEGYQTAAIVANPLLFEGTGFERGFDHYRVATWEQRRKTLTGERLLDAARELLPALREPFFLWLHLYDPHDPYNPPPRLLPVDELGPNATEYRARQPMDAPPIDEAGARRLNDVVRYYDGEVTFADECLGGVLDTLKQRDQFERTVIAVTADHGEGLFEHADYPSPHHDNPFQLYRAHGDHMYEEALHVPLVLRGGGFRGGRRHADPVENVDLFPTLLAVAGVSPDPGAVGRDLASPHDKPAAFAFGTRAHAMRDRAGMKLIHPVVPQGDPDRTVSIQVIGDHAQRRPELYDLAQDRQERRDLMSEHTKNFDFLRARLREWQERHKLDLDDSPPVSKEMQQRLRQLGYTR